MRRLGEEIGIRRLAENRLGSPPSGGAGGGSNDIFSAVSAICNSFTTPPDAARRALIGGLVTALFDGNIWPRLGLLYLHAAADSQAAKINWRNPGTFTCTEVNAPAFVADRGYTSDGSTSHLTTGCNILTQMPVYSRNDGLLGIWCTTNVNESKIDISSGASNTAFLVARGNGGDGTKAGLRLNTSSSGSFTLGVNTSVGLTIGQRRESTTMEVFKNGASLGTVSQASAAVSSGIVLIGSNGTTQWNTKQIAAAMVGGALNETQNLALYTAMLTYMQGVGAA